MIVSDLETGLKSFKQRVELMLSRDGSCLDTSIAPMVDVMHDELGGSISITSYLGQQASESIRKRVSGKMESDVFMLACSGVFRMDDRSMKLNCAIVNEDGMPVTIAVEEGMDGLNRFVQETRQDVYTIFQSI